MKTKEQILNQEYLTAKDIKTLIPEWGINAIRKFMDLILEEMEEKNYYIIKTKQKLVATELVRKKLKI